ncbi:unnamed protein product [Cochlearia groenlandica]
MDESELPSLFGDEENQNVGENVNPTPAAITENALAPVRRSGDGENPRVKRARVERSAEAGIVVVVGSALLQVQTHPEGSVDGVHAALGATGAESVVIVGVDAVRPGGVEGETQAAGVIGGVEGETHIADVVGAAASDGTGEGSGVGAGVISKGRGGPFGPARASKEAL